MLQYCNSLTVTRGTTWAVSWSPCDDWTPNIYTEAQITLAQHFETIAVCRTSDGTAELDSETGSMTCTFSEEDTMALDAGFAHMEVALISSDGAVAKSDFYGVRVRQTSFDGVIGHASH